ncbi:MAG TPA: hypothetical protein VJ385_13360 [Fibrobacteria bacterium]|nr:hypothetical protein [Fibrobacteria bacterium]
MTRGRTILGGPLRLLAFLSAAGAALSMGSGPIAVPNEPSTYLPVKTLYRGATVYGTGKPVGVRFIHSTAEWGNQLFFMNPRTGEADPLFLYYGSGRKNRCPDSGGISADLGTYDSSEEIVLMMTTVASRYSGAYCTGEACGPRYTGLNDPLRSRFYSRGQYAHMARHLWAEAARVTSAQVDSMADPCAETARIPRGEDGVLFSFNDGANDTFGDMVVLVTGVQMDVERSGRPLPPDTGTKPDSVAAECRIEASAGGVSRGESFLPQPMALPVSAILPRADPSGTRMFMDQRWRIADPRRPDETRFPNGPDILVTTPGPFEFNLGFFTNQGGIVNRARGTVSAEMLEGIRPGPDGRRSISLMWYPASATGYIASTGAYVVKGWLRTLPPGPNANPGERPASCKDDKINLLSSFGYIRR